MNGQMHANQFILKGMSKNRCPLSPIILKYRQELPYPQQGKCKTEAGKVNMLTPGEKQPTGQGNAKGSHVKADRDECGPHFPACDLGESHSEPPFSSPQNQY